MHQTNLVDSGNHYCRFSLSPACSDALTLRKAFEDALEQTFGAISARSAVDILWTAEDGTEVLVRTATGDAPKLLAVVATYDGSLRLTLIKESPFLPSLLRECA
ncbi:hypothetical protein K523DRAFT_270905 [Schizophyllum commune Tattone D]|nr:hypothetical protein K523DRAFT_270905 [Schizophyllum commune Tattone D]